MVQKSERAVSVRPFLTNGLKQMERYRMISNLGRFCFCELLIVAILLMTGSSVWSGEYLIGPKDILTVDVWDEKDISGDFPVSSKGTINHPLLKEFAVAGKSISQIGTEITEALKKDFLVNPRVSVAIKTYGSKKVNIFGKIEKPGIYEIDRDTTLLKLILKAGGTTKEAAQVAKIVRLKSATGPTTSGEIEMIKIYANIEKLIERGDLSQDHTLEDGDIVFIAQPGAMEEGEDKCYVLGAVKKPGQFEVSKGYTLLSAIIDAGGLTEYASPNSTKLVRGSGRNRTELKVKVKDLMEKGDQKNNIVLQPGDMIIVPEGIF